MNIELLRLPKVLNFLWTNLANFGIYRTILTCLKLFVTGVWTESNTLIIKKAKPFQEKHYVTTVNTTFLYYLYRI